MVLYFIKKFKILILLVFASLFFSCGREVATESETGDQTLYKGQVYVNTNPTGSVIYIDNKNSGFITPDTVKGLNFGTHTIKLSHTYLLDTTFSVNVQNGVVGSAFVNYYASPKNFGNISCTSTPTGIPITLNGSPTLQNTPHQFTNLFPGSYNVKYSYQGYRADSSTVIVYGGKSYTVSIALQDTTKYIDYRINNSNIPSNKIVAMKIDSKSNVWIGTVDNGIAKEKNGVFTKYNTSNSKIPYNFITCLAIDANDNVWVGTISGLGKFDGTNWTTYTTGTSSLPDNYISGIYCAPNLKTWVSTTNGLACITNNSIQVYNTANSGILSNIVSSSVVDQLGRVWIAGSGGISMLDNGTWKTFTRASDGLIGFNAGLMSISNTGTVWCSFPEDLKNGISGGAMEYVNNSWRAYSISGTMFPGGSINCMYFDSQGDMWFGIFDCALVVFPDNSYRSYASKNYYMYSYDVRGIAKDGNNNLWLALYGGGIVRLKYGYY